MQKSLELVDHEVIDRASLDKISHKGFNCISLINDNSLKTEVSHINVNIKFWFAFIILLVITITCDFLIGLCMLVVLIVKIVVFDSRMLIIFAFIILLLLLELRKISFVGSVHGL